MIEPDREAMQMTFVVYIDPDQGDVTTFVKHMANGFVELFTHELEAHGVVNKTEEVMKHQRSGRPAMDPLEAQFHMPAAPEPTIKENDDETRPEGS